VKVIDGCDLCSLQGNVDFDRMANESAGGPDREPMRFVYIKSSQYSGTPDMNFMRYADAAQKAGLMVGAYHFCSQASDPDAQMRFFYRTSGGMGKNPGELPPMIDWEYCTVPPPLHCVDWLRKALETAEDLWYPQNQSHALVGPRARKPVVYTYPYYAKQHQPYLDLSGAENYPLCQATYVSKKDYPQEFQLDLVKAISPWSVPTLLQYSGNGGMRVPGVSVDCDRDLFLGSIAEFEQFCGIFRTADSVTLEDK
jgi:lysozyme